MSGLNFASAGDFKPFASYNAKSGRWSVRKDGVTVEVPNPTFVADLENIKTGWFYFATGQAPQTVLNPSLSQKLPRPEGVDAKGKALFKEGFTVDLFSQATFGGVVGFTSNSDLVRKAMNVLYQEYQEGLKANPGKLPVVEFTGSTPVKSEHGTNYAPQFKLVKFVDRPVEFSKQVEAANTQAPVAAKASVSEF